MTKKDFVINRPIVVVAEEMLEQLKQLNAALKGANAAAAELAVNVPQEIKENKIEYRDADNQHTAKEAPAKKKPGRKAN